MITSMQRVSRSAPRHTRLDLSAPVRSEAEPVSTLRRHPFTPSPGWNFRSFYFAWGCFCIFDHAPAPRISPDEWTRAESADLADRADVGIMTIHQLEKGSQPRRATLSVVRSAFEAAGVEFIDENGGGTGVRLRKPSKKS